ncbi:MAG: nitroreductase family protein, partial [Anaerolineae bacterium]|nr:nitroreductase family protein [Anaerolineae bacterium]
VPYTRDSVPFDLGRAAQNMMVAARSEGVGSVMATLYQTDRAAEALKLPAGLTVPWCISFGYPAEEPAGPPRKGGRRSFEEVVHWEEW